MTKLSILLLTTVTAIGCGDNLKVTTDGGKGSDGGGSNSFPAAPALGVQIDRLGRPAINTVLNHGFDPNAATAGPAKDAYNQDGSPAGWLTAYAATFAGSLAILDGLDTGLVCLNGVCTPTAQAKGAGCGNQVVYNGMLAGDPSGTHDAMSYATLAGLLTDDELWLDTTKTTCDLPNSHQNYLGVELNALSGGNIPNTCGGRDPLNDVIDTSLSALAAGFGAFNVTTFAVGIGDGVGPHADVSDTTFPFLGAPH